jgi:hypothetical protein
MKKHQTIPKGKLREVAKQLNKARKEHCKAPSNLRASASSAIDITQSPDNNITLDLSSPKKKQSVAKNPDPNATIDLLLPDTRPLVGLTNVAEPDVLQTESADDSASKELQDTPMKGDDNEDFTIKKIEDVSLLTPVKLHVRTPTKKRKGGDLLKRLQLDDVLFEDDEDELKSKKGRLKNDEDDDDDDNYPLISDEAKLQKASTQSTRTIEAFYCKYHATPAADDTFVTIDKRFQRGAFEVHC